MDWIAKSHLLPTTSKNWKALIILAEQSEKALNRTLEKRIEIEYVINDEGELGELISNLYEYTIIFRIYLERIRAGVPIGKIGCTIPKPPNYLSIDQIRHIFKLYKNEKQELQYLIKHITAEEHTKEAYILSLNRFVSVSGLVFLIYLHSDFCERLLQTSYCSEFSKVSV